MKRMKLSLSICFLLASVFFFMSCGDDDTGTAAPSAYTLIYLGNGGSPVPGTVTFTNGQPLTVDTGGSILRTNYVFVGWTNAAGTTVTGTITGGANDILLYASWTPVYTLTYIDSEGTPVPAPVTFTNGQQITIDDGASMNLLKHKFLNWTNAAGTNVSGTITGGTSNITIYASWEYVRFQDNGDGTITDNDHNLMWRKNGRVTGTGGSTFHEMTNYCWTNTFAGYSDWRLPEVHEYQTLIDRDFSPIQINTGIFTNMSSSRYLSITKWYGFVNYRWYVSFYPTSNETLNTNATTTNSPCHFIPVRSIP